MKKIKAEMEKMVKNIRKIKKLMEFGKNLFLTITISRK